MLRENRMVLNLVKINTVKHKGASFVLAAFLLVVSSDDVAFPRVTRNLRLRDRVHASKEWL